jgi:hypothetical protein
MTSDNRGPTEPPSSRPLPPLASTAEQDAVLIHYAERAREAATQCHAPEPTDAVNHVVADVIPDIRAGRFTPGDQSITGLAWKAIRRVLNTGRRSDERHNTLLKVNGEETQPRYAQSLGDATSREAIHQLIVVYETLLDELPGMVSRVVRHIVDTGDSYVEAGMKLGLSHHTVRKYNQLGQRYFAHNLWRFDIPLPRHVAGDIPRGDQRRGT